LGEIICSRTCHLSLATTALSLFIRSVCYLRNVNSANHTAIVKAEAKRLGFDFCGISKAEFLEEEAPRLEKWLKEKMQGEMSYMENHFDMRLDPAKLVPGAKSVVSLLLNYYPEKRRKI